jgi:hypothetical protein
VFAGLFLFVYSLDYVPGIMDANGKMFGLFSMTRIVDIGHLVLGALAVAAALSNVKWARVYFYFLGTVYAIDVIHFVFTHLQTMSPMTNFLVNLPHAVTSVAAFFIAATVSRAETASR